MTLQEERLQLRSDLMAGREPKRVPIAAGMTLESACGLAGIRLAEAHYDMGLMEKAYTKVCETIFTDTMPVANYRFPAVYQMLGTKNWVVSSDGTAQHPEMEAMRADEYDDYTEDPYGFIVKTLLPRVCGAMNGGPAANALTLAKAYQHHKAVTGAQAAAIMKLSAKYGFMPGFVRGPQIEAPFDFLSDQLRGFRGINLDVRRCPGKIRDAVQATLPLMVKLAGTVKLPPGAGPVICLVPLHLAPYIGQKTFEELWWPTFERMVCELDAKGIACYIFAEQDWTRYAGYLARLPESSIIGFEDGDAATFKRVVGKNHVITGLADPSVTLTRSREECIDYVKRLVDVMAPGGRYYFNWGRGIMSVNSVDISKVAAMLEWLHLNTDY